MPTAWFITTYGRSDFSIIPARYCLMRDFGPQIEADGGTWDDTEVLGGYALVKVRASTTILQEIADTAGFFLFPVARLDDTLGSLSQAALNNLRDRVLAMGYTTDEILAALPNNWKLITFRQLAHFIASRRHDGRYDEVSDEIVLDGQIIACKSPDLVDAEVTE